MARKILVNIDLNGNQIQNVVAQLLAADPGSPASGQFWYNTSDNVMRYYDGSAVVDIGSGGVTPPFAIADTTGLQAALDSKLNLAGGTLTGDLLFDFAGADRAKIKAAGSYDGTPTVSVDQGFAGAGSNGGAELFSGGLVLYDKDSGNPAIIEAVEVAGDLELQISASGFSVKFLDDVVMGATKLISQAAAPTAPEHVANRQYVLDQIAALVDTAPATLDTLNELAAALGDDPGFATTVTNALATKAAKFGTLIGDGVSTSIAVTHSLGTRDVVVSVHDATTFAEVECDVTKTSTSVVTLGFAVAPASNAYRVTVIG